MLMLNCRVNELIGSNYKYTRYGSPEGPLTIFVFLFIVFYFSIFSVFT